MAITQLPIRMQLGGFPMFPPGMGPRMGMPRGGMGQVRRPPPPSDADEGGRRAPTPYSLEDLSPRHFQAPRAPNLFVGGPPVYDPSQSFPSFGGYGGNLPQVPRYGGRTGGPFGPPPPPRGYPMGGGMPGFGRGAMPFRPRPQAPQFDFDEDQMRSFFQNMMGPQDNTELTTLQDRIKELEGQISGFQKPAGGVEEETTVTETETTPTPTPGVPAPTPQDSAWQLPPEIQEQIDALQVDIPNINLPGLGRTEPNGDQPSSDLPPVPPTVGPPGTTITPPAPSPTDPSAGPQIVGHYNQDQGTGQYFWRNPDGGFSSTGRWKNVPANVRDKVYGSQEDLLWSQGQGRKAFAGTDEEYEAHKQARWAARGPQRITSPTTAPVMPEVQPPYEPPPLPTGQPLLPSIVPPAGSTGYGPSPQPTPIGQQPLLPPMPGKEPRTPPFIGRGPGAPPNISRQPRVNMEQLLAGLGGLGPGGL